MGKYGLHSLCKICANIKTQNWRKQNKTRKKQYDQIYNNKNSNIISKYKQNWYEDNKDDILEKRKQRYKNNKEYILEQQKSWRKTSDGKKIVRAASARRRAKQRSSTQWLGKPNKSLINKIYKQCPIGYHVDHIMAISIGGQHHQSNLCYLPEKINLLKSNKTIEEFGNRKFTRHVIYWQDILK